MTDWPETLIIRLLKEDDLGGDEVIYFAANHGIKAQHIINVLKNVECPCEELLTLLGMEPILKRRIRRKR